MANLLLPGLVSVTFRQLSWEQIIDAVVDSDLRGIEWGGDVHVPVGDVSRATRVQQRCREQNISISAYGSYYRLGDNSVSFEAVLNTALALGADTIRVWAGTGGSQGMSDTQRALIVEDLHRCCQRAASHNISIATEFHAGTLTDQVESCINLINAADAANARTFWQPPNGVEFPEALTTLRRVSGILSNVHVFHWWPTGDTRHALQVGRNRWLEYLRVVADQCRSDGRQRFASLEFVREDDVEQLKRDAQTLKDLIAMAWVA